MDLEQIQELIRLFEASPLSEIEIEEEGKRIRLRKPRPRAAGFPSGRPDSVTRWEEVVVSAPRTGHEMQLSSEAPLTPAAPEEKLVTIDSPMVGVFYAAPAPGEPAFVKPGDMVEANQTVCIVEAMKLMNEVAAKFSAVVTKVLVENGEPVEFGQPLFAIEPLEST